MSVVMFDGELVRKELVAVDVISFVFRVESGFKFLPGQFVNVHIPFRRGLVSRAYSIVGDGHDGMVGLCVKLVDGVGSRYLKRLKVGDSVKLSGPYGRFVIRDVTSDMVMFCAGTGVAPFLSMIPFLLKKGTGNILLIAGYRSESGIIFDSLLKNLESKSGGRFVYRVVLSRPEREYEYVGHVQDFFDVFVPKNFKGDFYMCGLKAMVYDVRGILEKQGVERERIIFEKYD